MNSWQSVIERERLRKAQDRFDLAHYWRGKSYLAAKADQAEVIVRAEAFACALQHIPVRIHADEEICGSTSWQCDTLPADITDSDYQAAEVVVERRPQRYFLVGHDHTLPDYETILAIGIGGLIRKAQQELTQPHAQPESTYLRAMLITLEAFAAFVERHAEAAEADRPELADRLRRIASQPPETLYQAIQLMWLVHLALRSERRFHNAFGRVDQQLIRFYRRDLDHGGLTRNETLELFCHWWCKIEGLHEVTNLCIGGLTPEGTDATNELSYICLEATALVQSPSSNLSARFHDHSPDEFHRACARTIFTGVGFPAIFNDHVTIPALEKIGIPAAVARDYCMVGCIETMLPGVSRPGATAVSICRSTSPRPWTSYATKPNPPMNA
jgi:hypothetical protein